MMHRKTIEKDGLRVVNKDTHFMLIRTVMVRPRTPDQIGGDNIDRFLTEKEGGIFDKPQVVRCKMKTTEEARVAHRKGDVEYFQRIFDDTLANDARQRKAQADRIAELEKVEAAARRDIPIEQRLMRAPGGKVVRAVWVMPWWKRLMRWIKSKILPTKIVMPADMTLPQSGGAQAAPASLTPTTGQPHPCPSPSCREGAEVES